MADKSGSSRRIVLILKSKKEDDNYEKLLTEHGYKPVFLPVLSFKFINQEDLAERLENPDKHNGLVLTSQRAVEAIELCVQGSTLKGKWDSLLKDKWSQLPVFVTGKATGKLVREKLQFRSIFGEESGNASALAEVILSTLPSCVNKELLFPCANIKKETLPNIMKEKGYGIYCLTAYCTQPEPKLLESLQNLFIGKEIEGSSSPLGTCSEMTGKTSVSQEQPAIVVFFSPSGVNFTHSALKNTVKTFESTKFVAIGQSTSQEMEKYGLTVSGVPEKPDPQSLLKVIDSILN